MQVHDFADFRYANPSADLPVKRVLRSDRAASYLGLSQSYLDKARLTGDGPPFIRIGIRAVGYVIDDLDAWINARARHLIVDKA